MRPLRRLWPAVPPGGSSCVKLGIALSPSVLPVDGSTLCPASKERRERQIMVAAVAAAVDGLEGAAAKITAWNSSWARWVLAGKILKKYVVRTSESLRIYLHGFT